MQKAKRILKKARILKLIGDTKYELPVGYKITKANVSDFNELVPMVEKAKQHFGENIETLCGDRGYDSIEHNEILYDKYRIKPVIDIRNMWRDKEETR